MQLFERLCTTFLHTMPHLFPTAVSIVVKMSSPHCRMQKEGGILMRLPCEGITIYFTSLIIKQLMNYILPEQEIFKYTSPMTTYKHRLIFSYNFSSQDVSLPSPLQTSSISSCRPLPPRQVCGHPSEGRK